MNLHNLRSIFITKNVPNYMQSQKENQRTSVKNSHVISQAKPHFSKNKQKENLGKQQFCVNLIYLPKKCTQMGKFQLRNSKKLS